MWNVTLEDGAVLCGQICLCIGMLMILCSWACFAMLGLTGVTMDNKTVSSWYLGSVEHLVGDWFGFDLADWTLCASFDSWVTFFSAVLWGSTGINFRAHAFLLSLAWVKMGISFISILVTLRLMSHSWRKMHLENIKAWVALNSWKQRCWCFVPVALVTLPLLTLGFMTQYVKLMETVNKMCVPACCLCYVLNYEEAFMLWFSIQYRCENPCKICRSFIIVKC